MTDTVTYGAQYTRNLGNFENARVFYEITSDVQSGESVDDAKDRVEKKVDGWVEAKVAEIDADASGK